MVMRVVTFKLEEEILEKVDRIARREGLSRSELIRKAIVTFIERYEDLKGFARIERIRVIR